MSMPETCLKCGELYDISYDLHKDDEGIELEIQFNSKNSDKVLCWDCRA